MTKMILVLLSIMLKREYKFTDQRAVTEVAALLVFLNAVAHSLHELRNGSIYLRFIS